jgi:hypothetical protein
MTSVLVVRCHIAVRLTSTNSLEIAAHVKISSLYTKSHINQIFLYTITDLILDVSRLFREELDELQELARASNLIGLD